MKIFLSLIAFVVGVAIIGGIVVKLDLLTEDGGYWSPNTVQVKSDAVSRIEATGEDLRLYEFTPRKNPNFRCAFVAGDRKGGIWCWPKATEAVVKE